MGDGHMLIITCLNNLLLFGRDPKIDTGLYFLNVKTAREHFLQPFILLAKEQGLRFMVIASFLWGITSVFAKQAINVSNVVSVVLWFSLLMVPFFVFLSIILDGKKSITSLKLSLKHARGWLVLLVLIE